MTVVGNIWSFKPIIFQKSVIFMIIKTFTIAITMMIIIIIIKIIIIMTKLIIIMIILISIIIITIIIIKMIVIASIRTKPSKVSMTSQKMMKMIFCDFYRLHKT